MTDTTIRSETPVPPEESLPRKSSNPLLWLLLLLALLAAIWFFYNRSASSVAIAPTTTPNIITGDSQQTAAQAERAQADANAARKAARAERAARTPVASKPRIADRGAEAVARVQPKYPPTAWRNREEGSVLVRADIDADGVPGDVSVVRRSGSRDLDSAALAAVRQWHFRPAIENGKAVASAVEVPVDFKLDQQ
ncbi:energy transducer TonB [Pseudoluteimonas lycopersici]|uniref:Protein TonB n=1 Tax=Pseudoluteimonas lycopersici TaxID=1324796 RepID=A0A516V378_9GAMM|nr:energy transducer TonB [Lysobacter lycopersici]QDQ72964.1 energy transducer TonB [Lysobacter lycopersici]